MTTFATSRDAKQYLVGRIVEEAKREDIPLSDIEIKMLYFSEGVDPMPDFWGIDEAFEREYDSVEYVRKIGKIIRSLCARDCERNTKEQIVWKEAVGRLSLEDHYINVMIVDAPGGVWLGPSDTSFPRLLRLVTIGVALFFISALIFMGYLILNR